MTKTMRSSLRLPLLGAISVLLVIGALPGSPAQAVVASCSGTGASFAGGAGTTASPYQVATQAQLASISGDYLSCAFVQTTNITLTGSWNPIGAVVGSGDPYLTNSPFTGTYDGNSNSIAGLSISASGGTYNSAGIGLFAAMRGATIEDLEVVTAGAPGVDASFRENVGILVGVAETSTFTGVRTSGFVRGLVGVGGIAGKISAGSTISGSSSSAAVGTYFSGGGGLVGFAGKDEGAVVSIVNSSASGAVTGTNSANGSGSGGLVGASYGGLSIQGSWATGSVSMIGSTSVGGLIGLAYGSDVGVARTFASGSVTVNGSGAAGGLVGGQYNGATIADSFAVGAVSGQVQVGGLVGLVGETSAGATATTTNSYSLGAVTTSPVESTGGGILGAAASGLTPSITSTYWNPTSSGVSATNAYGTQKSLAQMKLTSTYSAGGWDITESTSGSSSVWVMNPASGCLPYLRAISESQVGTPDTSGATECAVPAPAPGPAPAPAETATPTPTSVPVVIPTTAPTAAPVELPAGAGGALINGVSTPVTVAAAPGGNAVVVSAGGVSVEVGGTGTDGKPLPLAPDGSLIVAQSGGVSMGGAGFSPNSTVSLFLYSTPTKLGELPVSTSGSYSGSALIPAGIEAGSHTIQAVGYTPSGQTLALSVGVTVKSAAAIRGAKPVVRVSAGTKTAGAKFVATASGVQSRCTVRFWTKGSTQTVNADVAGNATAVLKAPSSAGTWAVTATVSGNGCEPKVTKTKIRVSSSAERG